MTGDPNSSGHPKWPTFDTGSDYVLSLGQKKWTYPDESESSSRGQDYGADLVRGTVSSELIGSQQI
jgi:hypothetical protein